MSLFSIVPDADPILDMILEQKEYTKCSAIFELAKEIICFRFVRNQVEKVLHKDLKDFFKAGWTANEIVHSEMTEEEYEVRFQEFQEIWNRLKSRNSGLYERTLLNLDIHEITHERIAELTFHIQSVVVQFFHTAREEFKEKMMLKPDIERIKGLIKICRDAFTVLHKKDPPKEIDHPDEIVLALFLKFGMMGEEKVLKFLTSDTGITSIRGCLSKEGSRYIHEATGDKICWDIVTPEDFYDYN